MPPLNPEVIDIQLAPPDQVSPPHGQPMGGVRRIVNGVVTKYVPPSPGVQPKMSIEQRNGFEEFVTTSRSAYDGTIINPPDWTNPQLLAPLGDQLLSVSNHVPRVENEFGWTYYTNERVLPNKLSERVMHTTQTLMEAPDSATIGGVTCFVWSQFNPQSQSYDTWVGFVDQDGAWIVLPRLLYTGEVFEGTNIGGLAKVVSDGTVFWVVTNHTTASQTLDVYVYTPDGQQRGTTNIAMSWSTWPGYWDISAQPALVDSTLWTMQLVQPAANTTIGAEVHAAITYFAQTGGTITTDTKVHSNISCQGPVAYLRTGFQSNNAYIASVAPGSPKPVNVYELASNIVTATYAVSTFPLIPDSITGYVSADLLVHVALSFLSVGYGPTSGPLNDPALREVEIWNCPRGGGSFKFKALGSVIAQSRSFPIDDEEYIVAYYQSGSGTTRPATPQSISHHSGDFFLGAASQPFTVSPGDTETGSPVAYSPRMPLLYTTQVIGSITHNAGDSATAATATWVFNNATFATSPLGPTPQFGLLNITGSAHAANNHTWRILSVVDAHTVITSNVSDAGTIMVDDTLSGVTASLSPATVFFWPDKTNLGPPGPTDNIETQPFNSANTNFFTGGTVAITGSTVPANNTTYTITSMQLSAVALVYGGGVLETGTVVILPFMSGNTTDGGAGSTISGAFTPAQPHTATFALGNFDTSSAGQLLALSGAAQPANNGLFPITSAGLHLVVNASSPMAAETFGAGVTGSINLVNPAQAFQITLGNATFDDSYRGAYLTIAGSAVSANNGIYRIDTIISSTVAILSPGNASSGQVNQNFSGAETITYQLAATSQPPTQPCWFLLDMNSPQRIIGQWERGVAYADWRFDGNAGPNLFAMALSSVPMLGSADVAVGNIPAVVIPYRAQSFTAGQVYPAGILTLQENTVGLKQFFIDTKPGLPVPSFGEMLLPGPLAGQFSSSGFAEDGISLAFEQPFLVTKTTETSGLTLTPGGTYQYIVVAELTNDNGDRVYSIPSPALNVTLFGTQNSATIGGRMMFPTNHKLVGITIYRTAIINGIPTAEHYLITDPLDVNGNAFSFTQVGPGVLEDTWSFKDQIPDAAIVSGEKLYIDDNLLSRFPAPAFTQGVTFQNRDWVIAYDGSIWVSGQKSEGDALWFSPALRIPPPTDDKPVSLGVLDDYIVVGCERSMRYLAPSTLPDDTGRNGSLPSLVTLPFPNGATGQMATIRAGVAYGSTAGGVWLITRQLTNEWLSQPIVDDLKTPLAMTVDAKQRLWVIDGSTRMYTYDMVSKMWYEARVPDAPVTLTVNGGVATYQDSGFVMSQGVGYADIRNALTIGTPMEVDIQGISFGTVRNWKRLWALQAVGQWRGPHNLSLRLLATDNQGDGVATYKTTPRSTVPYVYEVNPLDEEASTWSLGIFTDFDGINVPGNSATIEMLGAEVGVETNISRLPATSRIPGK